MSKEEGIKFMYAEFNRYWENTVDNKLMIPRK